MAGLAGMSAGWGDPLWVSLPLAVLVDTEDLQACVSPLLCLRMYTVRSILSRVRLWNWGVGTCVGAFWVSPTTTVPNRRSPVRPVAPTVRKFKRPRCLMLGDVRARHSRRDSMHEAPSHGIFLVDGSFDELRNEAI